MKITANTNPVSIVLNVTEDCNFACKYCFVEQKPKYMPYEIAEKAIDFIMQNAINEKQKEVSITFFGGEPLLCWDSIIVPIIEYIKNQYNKDNYPHPVYSLTTNASLLTLDKIKYAYENNIYLLISIDGGREAQDATRIYKNKQSTFDLVEKNIINLISFNQQTNNPYKTIARATVSTDNVQYLFDSYLYINQLGFNQIFFGIDTRSSDWNEDNIKILSNETQKISNFIINCMLKGEVYCDCINLARASYDNFAPYTQDPYEILLKGQCGTGGKYVTVKFDGSLYTCQEQPSRETGSWSKIGDIFNGVDETLHQNLLDDILSVEKVMCEDKDFCQNICFARNHCNVMRCLSNMKDVTGSFGLIPKPICQYHDILARNAHLMNLILLNNKYNLTELQEKICEIINDNN